MADEEYPLYSASIFLPIAAGLVVVLNIPPLVWHFRNRNLGACSLVIWPLVFNLFAMVNALIWPRDNVQAWYNGRGLCDLEVYTLIAGWTGLPSCLLCIIRNLAQVLDTKRQVVTRCRAQRVRQCIIDSLICWGPPALQLCLFDLVKVNRYSICGLNGCVPSLDTTWMSILVVYIWPLLICMVAGYYAVLVIVRLQRYRSEFSRLIQRHNTTRSRFVRLFLLSSLFILGVLPTQSIVLYFNAMHQRSEYSWSRNHDPEARAAIFLNRANGQMLPDRWIGLACGLLLFLFFGLGTDAAAMYRSWAHKLNPARLITHHRSSGSKPLPSASTTTTDASSSPSSPSRSIFSHKTRLTSTTASSSSKGGSMPKSFSLPIFWRKSADLASSTNSTTPVLPTHNGHLQTASTRTGSVASEAPTIDTTISMTPLSHAIRKASVGTLAEEEEAGEAIFLGSPVVGEKSVGSGLGIELGSVGVKRTDS
ncbi:a-pheromone receptor [Neofusicoccum parvum]|uniref:A-pheromone receptor n=1 Tax=Neofusicoccum parvum TaxID=310453 RepID=A0ACB5SFJ9_9PEZI|nr:a-pheromone receptor [Neofusicoccum parvum]